MAQPTEKQLLIVGRGLGLTNDQTKYILDRFDKSDVSGDGILSTDEIRPVLISLLFKDKHTDKNVREKWITAMVKHIDSDGSGGIGKEEFLNGFWGNISPDEKNAVKQLADDQVNKKKENGNLSEVNLLKEQLEEEKQKNSALEDEINKLKLDDEAKNKKIADLEAEYLKVYQKVKNDDILNLQIENLGKHIAKLIADHQKDFEKNEEDISSLNLENQQLYKATKDMKTQHQNAMIDKNKQITDMKSKFRQENQNNKSKISDLDLEIDEKNRKIAQMEQQLQNVVQQSTDEINKLKKEIEAKNNIIEATRGDVSQDATKIQNLVDEMERAHIEHSKEIEEGKKKCEREKETLLKEREKIIKEKYAEEHLEEIKQLKLGFQIDKKKLEDEILKYKKEKTEMARLAAENTEATEKNRKLLNINDQKLNQELGQIKKQVKILETALAKAEQGKKKKVEENKLHFREETNGYDTRKVNRRSAWLIGFFGWLAGNAFIGLVIYVVLLFSVVTRKNVVSTM